MAPSVVICHLLQPGKFKRSGLCLLFALSLSISCGPQAEPAGGGEKLAGTGEAALLWSIPTSSGSKLLLVGSLHLLGSGDHPLPQQLFDVLDGCDTLITETGSPAESQPEIERFVHANGTLPPGRELVDQPLGDEIGGKLAAYLEARPGAAARLQSLRPWLAALQIAMESYRGAGMTRAHGVDALLLERAAARGIRVAGLESPTEQLSALADLPWEVQVQLLGEVLDGVRDGTALANYARMKALWRQGDLSGLSRHVEAALGGADPTIESRLLDERNRRFATRIVELAELPPGEAADCLVLIGAGHLAGSRGVLALLAQRLGSAPRRIMPAEGPDQAP